MVSLQEQLRSYQPDPAIFLRSNVHTFPVNEGRHRDQILAEVTRDFAALPRERDYARVHLGVAGFFNFDMAATGRHDAMVLCDVNYDQVRFWNQVIKLLATCESPGQFKRAFNKHYEKVTHKGIAADYYFHVGDEGERVMLRFGSANKIFSFGIGTFLDDQQWIRNGTMYKHLHEMAKAGNIASVPLDAFNAEQCSALGAAIAAAKIGDRPAKLDTVYASNVYDVAMPQIHYDLLQFNIADFIKIAQNMERTGVNVRAEIVDRNSEGFQAIRQQLEYRFATGSYAPKEMSHKQMLRDYMVPITETFLEIYREMSVREANSIKRHRTAGVTCEERHGRNLHADIAEKLMNRLLSNPNIDQDFIGRHYRTKTPQHYYPSQRDLEPDYTVLRSLATDQDTKFYCASTYHRPLVKFDGPESPNKEWRDVIRSQENTDFATRLDASDVIGR